FLRLLPPQLLHRPPYPLPNRSALQITFACHFISASSGDHRSVVTVSLHEDLRGAEKVEVGDHGIALVRVIALLALVLARFAIVSRTRCMSKSRTLHLFTFAKCRRKFAMSRLVNRPSSTRRVARPK